MMMPVQSRSRRWKLRAGDLVIVVLVTALAAVSTVMVTVAGENNVQGSLAVVEVNGKVVRRITLGTGQPARKFTVDGWQGPSTFEIADGKVRMVSSDCRDKVCIGMGWISTNGRSIVCLPNRVIIRITGGRDPAKVDTVTE
jgi:hypothetical protein